MYKLVVGQVWEAKNFKGVVVPCHRKHAKYDNQCGNAYNHLANYAPYGLNHDEQIAWHKGNLLQRSKMDYDTKASLNCILKLLKSSDVMLACFCRSKDTLPHTGKSCHAENIQQLVNEHRGSGRYKPMFKQYYDNVSLKFLSNMYPVPIVEDGREYSCVEAAFVASKTDCIRDKEALTSMNGYEAKKYGRGVKLVDNWNDIKGGVMWRLLNKKFQHPNLKAKLTSLPNDYLCIEYNQWHDNIWGICKCPRCENKVQRNLLGKMLEVIRHT
jgi:ribA/ribD-fused uncharacterized protein